MIFLFILITSTAHADDIDYDGPSNWESFHQFMIERAKQDEITGLSYMISGGLAAVGGNIGYYSSTDTFSRGAYALTQSAGIFAIGYGASIYWNGNEFDSFYRAVRDSSLSPLQKTEVLQKFLENERAQKDREDMIRMGTFILLSAMNFYSATQEDDNDVKNVFNFLGGVNLLLAFSYAF